MLNHMQGKNGHSSTHHKAPFPIRLSHLLKLLKLFGVEGRTREQRGPFQH